MIKLQSSDLKVFLVDVEVAKKSTTIRTMLENLGITNETDDEVVPLAKVNSEILEKIIEWSTQHKDDPVPEEDDPTKEFNFADLSEWDREFLKMSRATLFDLVMAANFLDIQGLLNLTCKSIASLLIGKTPEEIRTTFNVKPDEEEKKEEDQEQNQN